MLNLLVPIDGSPPAALGLEQAIALAVAGRARIRLLHIVNELPGMTAAFPEVLSGDVLKQLRDGGKALLAQAEARVADTGIDVDTKLIEVWGTRAGDPIVAEARAWPADLIVCGTHGRKGLSRLVLGSDAEYVVRHSTVPVLLVPPAGSQSGGDSARASPRKSGVMSSAQS